MVPQTSFRGDIAYRSRDSAHGRVGGEMTEAVCSWEQVPVRVLVLAFLQVPIHVPARVLVLVQARVLVSFAWVEPRTTGR